MKFNLAKRVKSVLPVSLLLSFTFFIFGVLEMYITNIDQFEFSVWDLLIAMAPMFAVCLVVLMLIGILMKGKVRRYYIAVLFGLGLALYVQGNFLNNDFGILDGTTIDWSAFRKEQIISTALWVLLPAAAVVLAKLKPKLLKKAVLIASLGVVAIQLITLVVSYIPIVGYEKEKTGGASVILTTDGEFELSKNENVLVFLLDAFDAQYFTDMIEKTPEHIEFLDGFTLFDDVVGAYNLTKVSLPFILTGQKYFNEQRFDDYLRESFAKSELLSALDQRDFDVGIYTGKGLYGPSAVIGNQLEGEPELVSNLELAKMYGKLVAFRYFPQIVKPNFVIYSGDFNKLMAFPNEYKTDDPAFFTRLKTQSIQAVLDKPVFRFYHLFGAHAPFTMDENGAFSEEKTSMDRQIRGEMKILEEYFNQLKACGIYDDATIVIMADHGYENLRSNPSMLIKRPGETGDISINSTPVSYAEELSATFKHLILHTEDASGTFYDTTLECARGRVLLDSTAVRDSVPGYYLDLYEYVTYGRAKDADSFVPTGKVYSAGETRDAMFRYQLGSVMPAKDFLQATTHGFQYAEPNALSREKSSTLFLELDRIPADNLKLTINIARTIMWPGEISLSVNQNYVATKSADSNQGEISFVIPKEFINDEKLYLLFEYPGVEQITEQYDLGSEFEVYSFEWESIILAETKENATQDVAQDTHAMHLGPKTLVSSEVTEAGTIVHPTGMMHGYYMLMPEGEYYLTVTGSNLDQMSLSIQGKAVSGENVDDVDELIHLDEEYKVYKFTLNHLTQNTNFVFHNSSTEDFVVADIILCDSYTAEPQN